MALSKTDILLIQKEQYGVLQYQQTKSDPVMDFLEDTSEYSKYAWNLEGRNWNIPCIISQSQSFGFIPEDGYLYDPGKPVIANMVIPGRIHNYSFDATLLAMEDTQGKNAAFIRATELQMENAISLTRAELGRVIHGNGSGLIAQVNGAVAIAGTTVLVDNPGGVISTIGGCQYIRSSVVLAVYDAANVALLGQITVTNVPESTLGNTLTIVGALFAIPDNANLYHANSQLNTSATKGTAKDIEAMGLRGMVNNAAGFGTYFGISRTLSPQMSATVFSAVGTLTNDLMEKAFSSVRMRGDNPTLSPDKVKFICEESVQRAYLAINEAQMRFTGPYVGTRDAGSVSMAGKAHNTIGGFEIIASRNAPYGEAVILNVDGFSRVGRDPKWDETQSMFKQKTDGGFRTLGYVADQVGRVNFYHTKPRSCVRLSGVTVNQFYVQSQ